MTRKRVGVLISGRGSNLQALIQAAKDPGYPAEIVLVLSNEPSAGGLQLAAEAGIASCVVDHRGFETREAFQEALSAALEEARVDLVCQAGFMRIVTASFVARWKDRLINIHPSLLPAFPGLDTHERALVAGVKLTGCTVHYVREAVDAGPIIGQAAVPVLPGDTPERLAARVLAAEHRLYPQCLALVAAGRVTVTGETAVVEGPEAEGAVLINPAPAAEPDQANNSLNIKK